MSAPLVEAGRSRQLRLPGLARGGRRSSSAAVVGAVMLGALGVAALAAPLISRYDPTAIDPAAALQAPGASHWFGTDQYGQDVFSRVLHAGRIDLLIGVVLVGVALGVGTVVGVTTTWAGGWVEAATQRVIDIGFAFPFLVLVIAMVGLRGPGLGSLFLAVSLVAWITYARLVRTEVRVVRRADYATAAEVSGFSTPRVLVRHVLPNVAGQLVVFASSDFVYAILAGASVSYLGLGVQPPTPEWGAMVQAGQNFLGQQWWIAFFPGAAIVYVGIACALLGDGLADRLRVADRGAG